MTIAKQDKIYISTAKNGNINPLPKEIEQTYSAHVNLMLDVQILQNEFLVRIRKETCD